MQKKEESIICYLVWAKKGFPKKNPIEYELTNEDIIELKNQIQLQQSSTLNNNIQPNFDQQDLPIFTPEIEQLKQQISDIDFSEIKQNQSIDIEDLSEDEIEDYIIKKNDNMIIAAKLDDEFSSLEIYIYEQSKSNLFVHHEIQLSAYPLCLEWICINPLKFTQQEEFQGNFVAVGTFLSEIEIWNLDIINTYNPSLLLGKQQKNKLKGKKSQKMDTNTHTDAVLCLSHNQFRKNILASGSADQQIKIWDLSSKNCVLTISHHKDKVNQVKWNIFEEQILISTSYDKNIFIHDVRYQLPSLSSKSTTDITCIRWDLNNSGFYIYYSTENGEIFKQDIRKFNQILCQFNAHEKETSSIALFEGCQDLLVSCSYDGSIKAWNMKNNNGSLIQQKFPKQGKLHWCEFQQDASGLLGIGSSTGELIIWDILEDEKIQQEFNIRNNAKQ